MKKADDYMCGVSATVLGFTLGMYQVLLLYYVLVWLAWQGASKFSLVDHFS